MAEVTQQRDSELGAQPMAPGLEACHLHHKASGSQSMATDQHPPSLPGNGIELHVLRPHPTPLESETLGMGTSRVLTNPPGGSATGKSLTLPEAMLPPIVRIFK